MPTWIQLIIGICGLVLTLSYRVYKEKKDDKNILHTAPDDPVGVSDIDERERLQDSSRPYPKP